MDKNDLDSILESLRGLADKATSITKQDIKAGSIIASGTLNGILLVRILHQLEKLNEKFTEEPGDNSFRSRDEDTFSEEED